MAKVSAVQKNKKREKLARQQAPKRARLRAITRDESLPPEERFAAQLKLAQMARNGASCRVRNRCELTGRPRGFYRKFKLSRVSLRDLASIGQLPGVVKSSW